jgi:hypothetical protein
MAALGHPDGAYFCLGLEFEYDNDALLRARESVEGL